MTQTVWVPKNFHLAIHKSVHPAIKIIAFTL